MYSGGLSQVQINIYSKLILLPPPNPPEGGFKAPPQGGWGEEKPLVSIPSHLIRGGC